MNQSIPSVSDPAVSRSSLFLGFSYSLTSEGAPGKYNEQIAHSILRQIELIKSRDDFPHLAVQWEICDAFGQSYSGPKPQVAGPLEERDLPRGSDALLPFQTQRVNRLIIEAVCPDPKILRRGRYLSTQGVLDGVLAALASKRHDIKHVFVFGHPAHSPRCRKQTIESLWKADWQIPLDHIYDVHQGRTWPRDKTTAQIWCRTDENWTDYEKMGVRRL